MGHVRRASLSLRPVADRVLPRRRGAHRAVQLGAGPPARRHVRAAHRGHRRGPQPAGVDAGHHRRAGLDRHQRRRPDVRGPVLPERLRRRPRRRRRAAVRRRPGLLLRPDARADPGARQGASGTPGYDGYSRDRGLGPGPGPGAAVPGARRRRDGRRTTSSAARSTFANDTIEDFVLLRGNGTPMFLLANVVDDIEMGITHVRARRGAPAQHAQAAAAVGGARRTQPPVVGPRAGARQRAAQEAVEAARQGGARAVPRRGLPRRRDGQLPDDARLGAEGRHRDRAVVEIEDEFRLEDVTHSPAFFDIKKLAAFNGEYIRALSRRRRSSPRASRGCPTHYDRGRVRPRSPRCVQTPGGRRSPRCRPMVDFLFLADAGDRRRRRGTRRCASRGRGSVLDDDDRGVRARRRGTPTR